MKIRDIRQYIRELCKHETLDLIGKDNEEWFKYVYGPNKKLDASITEAATFATNAEEQLFYEFVQNAFDAKADSLYFFFNEKYLIVLNNGVPFYTDLDLETNPFHREGQLYTFLSKNKSDKYGNSHKMGEHGQGSKLLYTLLTDHDEWKDNNTLLLEAIKTQKKGPSLISWSSRSQIANLCLNFDNWEPSQIDNDKEYPLFIKILYSYYPVMPGQSEELFPKYEVSEVLQVFNDLVQPRRNISFLDQGSALIIPLGKGKYDRINNKENLSKVQRGLGGFVSLTNAYKYNDGRDIEHIYIQGKEIDMLKVEAIKVEFTKDDTEFRYVFGFNPDFATKDFVNLYKGLPIIESQYKLGFIIDSQSFGVDNSRQRIIAEKEKIEKQLIQAFSVLKDQLVELKDNNIHLFTYIYKSLACSKIHDIPESASYIKGAFKNVFVPFFKAYYLSINGSYYNYEEIIKLIEPDGYVFPLDDIGVEKHWADLDIEIKLRNYLSIHVNKYSVKGILDMSDEGKMTRWIVSLSETEYKSYHKFCLSHIDDIKEYPLFRSNKSNIYSYEEIIGEDNILFCTDMEKVVYNDLEHIIEPITTVSPEDYYRALYMKVKCNIASYRASNARKDTAVQILLKAEALCSSLSVEIPSAILLFQNWNGEYLSFDNLFIDRPLDTALFDAFRVKGYIPAEINHSWFIQPEKNPYDTWTWILENIESIKKVDGWREYASVYIKDLRRVYRKSVMDEQLRDDSRLIKNFYIDENGCPSSKPCMGLQNKSSLNTDEYELVMRTFPDFNFINEAFYRDITSAPFVQTCVSTKELINSVGIVDKRILSILIKLSNNFLDSFCVKEVHGKYTIKEKKYEQYNYIYDNIDENIRLIFEAKGLFIIPTIVQEMIPSVKTNDEYSLIRNSKLMEIIINRFDNKLLLFPIVKDCNSDVVKKFFYALPYIDVSSSLDEEDTKWKVIKYGGERSDIRHVIFNKIQFNANRLPQNIKQRFFHIESKEYDAYLLDDEILRDNQCIESFFEYLPSKECEEWFRHTFYANCEEVINIDDLYLKLKSKYLNTQQIRFMLDVCRIRKYTELPYKLNISDSIESVLNMALENKFKHIDNFINIPGYDRNLQVFANEELLLNEEKLSNEIYCWINNHEGSLGVFSHIITKTHPLISLRDAIFNNKYVVPEFDSQCDESYRELLLRTMQWIASLKTEIFYQSNRYDVCRTISENLPRDFYPYYALKFIGYMRTSADDGDIPQFIYSPCSKGSSFICSSDLTQSFIDNLHDSSSLKSFIRSNPVFIYKDENELWSRGLMPSPIWKVTLLVNENEYDEWEDTVYNKWRQTDESNGIVIKLSDRPIEVNLAIKTGNIILYQEKTKKCDFGYIWDKLVVVKYQQETDKSVFKKLSSAAAEIDFFKRPFIQLQSMYIDELEELSAQKKAEADAAIAAVKDSVKIKEGELIINIGPNLREDKIQEVINNISEEAAENIESLNEIVNSYDEDEICNLIANKNIVKQILDDVIEEEKESQVRQTIGFIGELIYAQYLDNKHKEYVHAALEGVGDYDFEVKSDKLFVDVKTTLYSLKDGTAPFYLHRSQNVFMQKHPDSKYHIVRISLDDLNLRKSYEELRDTYGRDANPMENPHLEKRCRAIVKRYWKGAKIEEFDALSPEYAIKIEQKINQ